MAREGRYFEVGFPHFSRSVQYAFPNRSRNYADLLVKNKEDLAEPLLDGLRKLLMNLRCLQ
tara:strand:+ start:1622 stop:1804 length:183 start_codon:yes stop_codon:yes gene_type:complete